MKKIAYVFAIFIGICALSGLSTSCNRDVFDIETYDTLAKLKSPVDTVDPNHTWMLSTQKTIIVNVNGNVGATKLQVLTDDPLTSTSATVLAQNIVTEGSQFSMLISYPTLLSTLYYALVDDNGAYTVVKAATSVRDIEFSNPLYVSQKPSYTPPMHYYSYCYEQELPEFGDYDYNDVVLHIAMERTSEKEMQFHVALAAVGATIQLASFIRLPGIEMSEIDSVYTLDGKSFNVNMHGESLSKQLSQVEESGQLNKLLLEGKKGEPILNLFADAHWAVGEVKQSDEFGIFTRKKYNVAYGTTTTNVELMPREITFVVRVKDGTVLNYLTHEDIDPFVMRLYGNSRREIHTFPYRTVDALYENKYIDIQNLPWALVIPTGVFCHPLDGVNIGFRLKTEYNDNVEILFGAYSVSGHSFGEWSVNSSKATDWYLKEYGSSSQIYIW